MKTVGLLAALALAACPLAGADPGADELAGVEQVLVLGPTEIPDPSIYPGYLPTLEADYLDPLGLPSNATVTSLVTPECIDFGPCINADTSVLVNQVETLYNEGDISPTHPLAIVGYSQSDVAMSQAEQQLYDYGIPSNDLDFVMLGDPSSSFGGAANSFIPSLPDPLQQPVIELFDAIGWGNLIDNVTPSTYYPTDVFTTVGTMGGADGFAQYGELVQQDGLVQGALEAILGMNTFHGDYFGVPPSAIEAALTAGPVIDGSTDYFSIPVADPILTLVMDNLNILGF